MQQVMLALFSCFAVGVAVGVFYFTGLWLTIRRLSTSRLPWLLAISSFLLRLSVLTVTFFMVTNGRLENIFSCLAGFLAVRMVAVSRATRGGIQWI